MAKEFCFPLTEVKENGELTIRAQTGSESFPDALTEGVLIGPVTLEGLIIAVDQEASMNGVATGRWRFECTRCLTPVEEQWSSPLNVMAPIDAGPLDLTDEVRQAIALAQPMKIFCRPDCRGLCPVCRGNRNVKECGHKQAMEDPAPRPTRPRLTPRPNKG
ncbi:MAG: DUF177 domain-containing protein [Elusimicrobia bacterium]|nr:DUF177 domain-containing protein [Elusimicrobiota bacterium]